MNNTQFLTEQIDRLLKLEVIKKQKKLMNDLDLIKKRLNDKTFRIAVVGEFSSGKSTFINAMIGKDLLKHASSETTAAITHIINVQADDSRIGKCEIEFSSGKKEMTAIEMLRKYTTVNQEFMVADNIRCVSVFVHFLDVAYPLVITDTPGLNGIADKHREITLNEIKKAHACIYLLSNNGVKLSDKNFLKIIMNYQSRFIFIQNFIDLLRISEGETPNSKLEEDLSLIKGCVGEDSDVKYNIYGISAVKAIAAKDLSKDKVFADDEVPISDRNALMEESNFRDFEKGLADIINSGEYLDIICCSAIQALEHIFELVGSDLAAQQEVSDSLRNNDDREKRNEKIRNILEEFKKQIPRKKKTLNDFIQARDVDNRNAVKEHLLASLKNIYDDVSKKINSDIKVYEDFERIEREKGCIVPKYYSDYVSVQINGKIIPDINKRAVDSLDHIYEEALIRIADFVSSKDNNGSKRIDINIVQKIEKVSSKVVSEEQKIKNEKAKLEEAKRKKSAAEDEVKEKECLISNAQSEVNQETAERDRIRYYGDNELRRLGQMPAVGKKSVRKTRVVERRGLFKIFDLFSTKTETYTAYEDDYTAQNDWKKRKADIESSIDSKLRANTSKLNRAIQKRDALIRDKEQKQIDAQKYDDDIRHLTERIKNEEVVYNDMLKQFKKELCTKEKQKLIDEMFRVMLDKNNPYCTLFNLQSYIDKISENNLKLITDKIMDYFDSTVQEKQDMLNDMLNKNEEALNVQYELSKREAKELDDIIQKCIGAI